MRLLSYATRSLRVLCQTVYPTARRSSAWMLWLVVALIVAAALSPGQITASRLVFQSSPPPAPVLPTPTPTLLPPPPPPPAATPLPAATPITPSPTPVIVPIQPSAVAPTQPLAAEPVPDQPAPATEGEPAQDIPAQPTEPLQPPSTAPETAPSFPTQEPPVTLRSSGPERSTQGGPSQPVINWIKFWDTMAVILAYPWLCCGVSLLLVVPLALLFLEIKGRRPPPVPPERLPGGRRSRRKRERE